MGGAVIFGIEGEGRLEMLDRGFPIADRVFEARALAGEVLQRIGIGGAWGGIQRRFALAEKGVAEIVMGLAAERFVPVDESLAVGFGSAFVIAEAVGGCADAHVEAGTVGGGEAFGEGSFVGLDRSGEVALLVGLVA